MKDLRAEVQTITAELEAERDRMAAPPPQRTEYERGGRPGDDFNRRVTADDVRAMLEQAEYRGHRPAADRQHFTRPGKKELEVSGTLFFSPLVYYNFSDNDPHFKPNASYTPFSMTAHFEHGGDFSATARELAGRGYGEPPAKRDHPAAAPTKPTAAKKVCGMSLSAMKTRFSQSIEWLFSKLIPARMPVIINGREGLGKTTICLAIVKHILERFPDCVVLWLATEGTVADTFIKAIDLGLPDGPFQIAAKGEDDFLFNFRSEQEQKLLDDLLTSSPKRVIAVFIDSVRGMTSQDPNSEEIGNTMRRLNSIVCDKHGAALVYLHHWNKKAGASWLDRNTGSTAITAAVRLVLSVLPNSKYSRKLVVSKSNMAEHIPAVNVVKQGEEIHFYDAEEDADDSQIDMSESFLLDMFKEHETLLARAIYRTGLEKGFSEDALKRAKSKLRIQSFKSAEGWVWSFPAKTVRPCALALLNS
jgi:hypothetical protein